MSSGVASVLTDENTPIILKYPVKLEDTVYARSEQKSRPVVLTREIAVGGEGHIYETNVAGFVAKIFKIGKLDKFKEQKIKLMSSKQLSYEGICFPIAPLYNKEHKFVGYLMRKAQGTEIQRSIFLPPIFKQTFPTWQKRDMVRLCLTILEKIKFLHDHEVVLGDLNPANILVVSPHEIYFVDTDSYQVGGFPCPVGMMNFIAPEIQQKNFRHFLRTKGHDHFAIATLLFMLMLPGQKPYAKKGGTGNLLQNIKEMDFPYEVDGSVNDKIPNGAWSEMWNRLTPKIRLAFYHTFHESGIHNCEKTRYTVEDWLQKFQNYWQELGVDATVRQNTNPPILMYGLTDVTESAEKIISLLYYGEGYTKTVLLKLLKGNDKMVDHMERAAILPFLGSLKSLPQPEISHLIDYLLVEEFLNIGAGRKKVLQISEKGMAYLLQKI